jgi:hypothetical protein
MYAEQEYFIIDYFNNSTNLLVDSLKIAKGVNLTYWVYTTITNKTTSLKLNI